jgi:outer membrane protein TolC
VDADAELRAESDVFAARARLSEAELDLADALFELQRFTGAGVEGVEFGPGVGVADLAQFRETFTPARLAELNPRIQVARAELDVAERTLAQVRGTFQPTANLTLEYSDEQTEGSLFGGGSNVQTGEIGVELAWSIYEGGVRRSRVREAERRVEIAELRLRQQQDRAERRYTSLISALERSLEAAAAAAQDARVAAERYDAALAQQDAGRIGFERVFETQLRRDTARLQARLARLRAVRLQADLYALFGALDVGALSEDFANT